METCPPKIGIGIDIIDIGIDIIGIGIDIGDAYNFGNWPRKGNGPGPGPNGPGPGPGPCVVLLVDILSDMTITNGMPSWTVGSGAGWRRPTVRPRVYFL